MEVLPVLASFLKDLFQVNKYLNNSIARRSVLDAVGDKINPWPSP